MKRVNEERKKLGFGEIDKSKIKPDSYLWEDTTELSWINALLEENLSKFSQDKNSEKSRKIIAESVIEYNRIVTEQEKVLDKPLKYESSMEMREVLEQMKLNGWELVILSGNPKEVAEDKLRRSGFDHLFFKDGKLPDYKVYGEDILTRKEAFHKFEFDEGVYFGDRESDLSVVTESKMENLKLIWLKSEFIPYETRGPVLPAQIDKVRKAEQERRIFINPFPHGILWVTNVKLVNKILKFLEINELEPMRSYDLNKMIKGEIPYKSPEPIGALGIPKGQRS